MSVFSQTRLCRHSLGVLKQLDHGCGMSRRRLGPPMIDNLRIECVDFPRGTVRVAPPKCRDV